MFRVELSQRDGNDGKALTSTIAGLAQDYLSPEAALEAVLPLVQQYAIRTRQGLWLRIVDARSQPVFGTLVP
ncbi:hypothetical protein [Lysobacter silvisoli]|uniref:hypothetical protein n=1 Tax=Lysobacter silvisoli TaxID=2293254 RepID=UPI0018C8A1DA|nr:hypothetical protein [Lysobacter silvisoli]